MGDNNSGPEEAIKGVVEGVKGKAKEVTGAVTGRDDLYNEGKAQQYADPLAFSYAHLHCPPSGSGV